jgi:hypothetical protein
MLRETFSAFSQKRLVARKNPAFSRELAEDCLKVEHYFSAMRFQDSNFFKRGQGVFASGCGLFRSGWRKNCSLLAAVEQQNNLCDSSWHESAHGMEYRVKKLGVKTRCFRNERRHITRKINCGFENFPLEERKILPIIIYKRARVAH